MITVGDLCIIDRMSEVKADALDIVDKWHNTFTSPYTDKVYELYKPDRLPGEADRRYNYTVEGIVNKDGTLYAICYAHGVNIVHVTTLDNLSVSRHECKPFKVGQLVTVTRPLRVYSSWGTFIDSLDGQIENYQDVCSRWVNGRSGDRGGVYSVVYIGRHATYPEDGYIAIIDDGSKAFIMHTDGLAETYAWEEYLQYLRNWAAKYTEYTPGHASPKSYDEWVQARNGKI